MDVEGFKSQSSGPEVSLRGTSNLVSKHAKVTTGGAQGDNRRQAYLEEPPSRHFGAPLSITPAVIYSIQ